MESPQNWPAKVDRARTRLLDFTLWTKPDYEIGRPHVLLTRKLDLLVEGSITRLMVFMPPRNGKSELVSRRLPAFYLGLHPDHEVIVASYAAGLANRMNRDVQRIIDTAAYRELFPGTILNRSGFRSTGGTAAVRASDLFEIVGHRGSLRSAGVGGGITGMGGHLLIVDDSLKNHEEAHSATRREKLVEWYDSTLWTRQAPGARILIVQTRWHCEDLPGVLISRAAADPQTDQWDILRLPAIAEGVLHPWDDRLPGQALWPERFNEQWLSSARSTLGAYVFSGMYQQNPTAEGGNHFKEAWFWRRWQDGGTLWHVHGERFAKCDCPVFVTCDPAASEKQTADYTAIGVWATTPLNDLLLLEVVRERLGVDGIIPKLLEISRRWNPSWIGVEANGFQVSLTHAARRTPGMPPIRQLNHGGKGKLVRATPAILKAESGQIVLPASAPWVKAYIDELTRFTGLDDKEDDQVDMTAYAIWKLPEYESEKSQVESLQQSTNSSTAQSDAAKSGIWGRRC